ncbi:MAG: galactose-1-phosphate uridylyltransferase [Thermoprotei archaeon]|nr:MAG: galactose-1-phosphate uridylyltransferase [Thermoprotei archaeon]
MSSAYNELRWNPLLGTWVVVSSGRRRRPWRKVKCPFCPGSPETGYEWDVLVLDNRFPALRPDAKPSREGRGIYRIEPGYGYCKVVVETPQHEGDLCDIPLETLAKYIEELRRVTEDLCGDPRVEYVMPFRNKGEIIGVSLTHPHSQIYALPFIPPRVAVEMRNMERFWVERGECLLCHVLELEREEGSRLLYENGGFTAFLPFYAMWPYEVHVYANRHIGSLQELAREEVYDLADALKVLTAMYNSLFDFSLPYMLIFHQKPCKADAKYFHFHLEFYPVHRERDKLKYAAGIEWGAWVFTYDALPEDKALELRKALERGVRKLESRGYEPRGRALNPTSSS